MTVPAWWIYRGDGVPRDWELPNPPWWRAFSGSPPSGVRARSLGWLQAEDNDSPSERRERLASAYRADRKEALLVNAAIYLRRPLLVTGRPGVGKSTLAYSIAHELKLGDVLHWPITSRTTLQDGLYRYDAIGRLQASNLDRSGRPGHHTASRIGRFLSLGPLGTALLPHERPKVLLIDEFDKGDIDLANDLLTVLEEGRFEVRELQRQSERVVTVLTDDGQPAQIERGRVECAQFPIIVITSNGERQFPPAFIRRCLRLPIGPPALKKLREIVAAHLGEDIVEDPQVAEIISEFADNLNKPDALLATDQLLNYLCLRTGAKAMEATDWGMLEKHLLSPLDDHLFDE